MEGWNSVRNRAGGILFDDIFLQGCLESYLPVAGVLRLLQNRNACIDGVVEVDIVRDNFRLDSPLFPTILGPLGLDGASAPGSMHWGGEVT